MSELKSGTQALLELGRTGDDPSDEAVAHNRRALSAKLGAAALAGGAIAAPTVSAAAALGGGWASAKVLALCATLLVGGGALGVYSFQAAPHAQSVPKAAPERGSAAVIAKAEPSTKAEPPKSVVEPAVSARSAPPPRPSAPARAPSIQSELELIRAAQKHLHRREASAALGLITEHARRYPAGALSEEREASRVFALCQIGDVTQARAQAQRFLERSPRSPFVERIRASCAGTR